MRNRPDRDPSMIRPHTKASRTFAGTVEKNRVSCICYKFYASYICYLFKMFFVRNFLQNFIGISSTSTTCNAMYIAGTILQIQITMKFHRQFIYRHHLQSHLHCANDPTLTNHNGILSTLYTRNTGKTPFTMRNRSEHVLPLIGTWSDHTRDRLARRTLYGKHRFRTSAKMHFVRDFPQNSIRNSPTSTTCKVGVLARGWGNRQGRERERGCVRPVSDWFLIPQWDLGQVEKKQKGKTFERDRQDNATIYLVIASGILPSSLPITSPVLFWRIVSGVCINLRRTRDRFPQEDGGSTKSSSIHAWPYSIFKFGSKISLCGPETVQKTHNSTRSTSIGSSSCSKIEQKSMITKNWQKKILLHFMKNILFTFLIIFLYMIWSIKNEPFRDCTLWPRDWLSDWGLSGKRYHNTHTVMLWCGHARVW